MAIFDDLTAEQDRLHGILASLDEAQWLSSSAAAGWTVTDVVLHLAQTEEAVVASIAGSGPLPRRGPGPVVDEAMEQLVRAERAAPAVVFQRWEQGRHAAVAALRAADPSQPLEWADWPLRSATLATTRLAEHWAHGLDITGPLGIAFPDGPRLRNVAWLAHRTLPYAFGLAGQPPQEVFCELTAPDGIGTWQFGPPTAASVVTGPAGVFCRVAAQRIAPSDAGQAGLHA
ncbi:MAG: maleylpyruvate isomerase family mycothiol-dependent enzyme, partial [Actinomycetota bacterium]